MKFDAMEAGLARPPGALSESIDGVMNFAEGHRTAQKSVQRLLFAARGQRWPRIVVYAWHVHLPARVRQLHDEFAVEAVHRIAELLPVRNEVVAMDGRVTGDDPALHQHRHVRRDNGANAALGEFAFPIDPRLRERAVFVVEPAGYARAENAVLDLKIVELQRSENDVVAPGRRSRIGGAFGAAFGHA